VRDKSDKSGASDGLFYVSEWKISRFVTFLGIAVATLFLIGAMWALWGEKNFVKKLAIVTGFVALFGLWVGLLTSAKRTEIFAATAAYAAVLVVYVGRG
jgi:hypothetical protein